MGNRRPRGRGSGQGLERIRKGKELNESLNESADALGRLMSKGWEGSGPSMTSSCSKKWRWVKFAGSLLKMGPDPDLAFEFEDDDAPRPNER